MTSSTTDQLTTCGRKNASGHPRRTRICVCILTYKRPELCRAALLSVLRQSLCANPNYEVSVLVVDNDVARSFEPTALDVAKIATIPIRYVVEPEEGVVCGRNRVLEEAQAFDFLAMLDDDETASLNWLDNLLRAQREFSADVVTGPVDAVIHSAYSWVVKGGFFAPRSYPTGTRPKFIETNNVLITGDLARRYRFDLRFNQTGGEDTYFFGRILRDGHRAVWSENVRVAETIPLARTRPEWLVDRAYSNANRLTRASLCLDPKFLTFCSRLLRATAGLGVGTVLFVIGFGSMARRVRARQKIGRFWGTVEGLRGRSHIYYQKGSTLS